MAKIKLLYVITALNFGGAEMNLYRLLKGINREKFDPLVVSLIDRGPVGEKIEQDLAVPVVIMGFGTVMKSIAGFISYVRLIRNWNPQIVHSHMVHANFVARWARLFCSFPVLICTIHNIEEKGKRSNARWRLLAYRFSDFLCDLTTQVSRAGLEKYVKIKAVPSGKILHIPNGIDLNSFNSERAKVEDLRQQLNLGGYFVFLAAGSLTVQKDYPNLLSAFKVYLEKCPESLLLIAGDGPLKNRLLEMNESLGLADSVSFLGLRRDIPNLMAVADVFVLSSAWEGLPVVLLEAAASSLPIIATDVGGNSEIVADGENGLLVTSEDHHLLAQAMIRLKELPEKDRIQMGKRGNKMVAEYYAQYRIIAQWEDIYLKYLKKYSNAGTL